MSSLEIDTRGREGNKNWVREMIRIPNKKGTLDALQCEGPSELPFKLISH